MKGSGSVVLACEVCGDPYRCSPKRAKQARFCSQACMRKPITARCERCGEEFTTIPARIKAGVRFCSQKCQNPPRVSVKCLGCGENFSVKPSCANRKYCSKECWDRSDRATRPCSQCGGDVTRPKSRMRSERVFCNATCRDEWARRRAGQSHPQFNRANVACTQCGVMVEKSPSQLSRGRRPFCGAECRRAWMRENYRGAAVRSFNRVVVNCAQCSTQFEVVPARVKGRARLFCGHDCYAEWKRVHQRGANNPNWTERESRKCAECGVEFPLPRWWAKRDGNVFCSHDCRTRWFSRRQSGANNSRWKPRIKRECAQCGTALWLRPHRIARTRHFFCSPECQGQWRSEHVSGENHHQWKGGPIKSYGPNWLRQRAAARRRDDKQCCLCATPEASGGQQHDVHHIVPFRCFGYDADDPAKASNYKRANRLDNLITLCKACHTRVEGREELEPILRDIARQNLARTQLVE